MTTLVEVLTSPEKKAAVVDDCCGNARDVARSDIGAIEYDGEDFCDTTRPTTAAAAAASRADQQ